jgi:hypothetical protein
LPPHTVPQHAIFFFSHEALGDEQGSSVYTSDGVCIGICPWPLTDSASIVRRAPPASGNATRAQSPHTNADESRRDATDGSRGEGTRIEHAEGLRTERTITHAAQRVVPLSLIQQEEQPFATGEVIAVGRDRPVSDHGSGWLLVLCAPPLTLVGALTLRRALRRHAYEPMGDCEPTIAARKAFV